MYILFVYTAEFSKRLIFTSVTANALYLWGGEFNKIAKYTSV